MAARFLPVFSNVAIKLTHRSVTSFAATARAMSVKALNQSLAETDPELFDIIEKEKRRQRTNLVLIASENFTSRAVLDALGSVMSNKYSEGYPGARYYGGNEFIDQAETMCQKRALEAFNLNPADWGVNVQSLSGSPANFEVYTALLKPHDRIMSLDLPHGGHLSHGYATPKKKISAVSTYFEVMPYRLNEKTGLIDYDMMETTAELFRPKLLVAGASAYARIVDHERMRKIADKHDAVLMGDMAHVSGLVAAGVIPSPFDHCHIVTTTTHKSLRGPRGAMIFYRKGVRSVDKKGNKTLYDFDEKINFSVFPGHQGGPHNHTISALATALKQAASPEFKAYQQAVLVNSKEFAKALMSRGYDLVSGGTDNHLVLVNLNPKGVDGARVETVLDHAKLAVNKNTVPGDKSALVPGGIRMGTPALTTRGFTASDFVKVAEYFDRAVQITQAFSKSLGAGHKLAEFKTAFAANPPAELNALAAEVEKFSCSFPTVGFEESEMKYGK